MDAILYSKKGAVCELFYGLAVYPKTGENITWLATAYVLHPFRIQNSVHTLSNSLIPVDWMIIIDWIPSYNQHLKFPITFRAMIGYH